MGLTAREPENSSDIEQIPEGMYQGICYRVYDLGTQYMETFNQSAQKVLIAWELPEQRIDIVKDGKTVNLPRAISREYTLSLHKKAGLRHALESWRGKNFTDRELMGFDLKKVLGANCVLQIIHNEKGYAKINNVLPLMPKMEKREPENPVAHFSFEEGWRIPDDTPEWIKKKIWAAEEWPRPDTASKGADNDEPIQEPPSPYDDDIPF